jgi:putative endonuclease
MRAVHAMFAAQIAHIEQATAYHRESGKKFRLMCMKSLAQQHRRRSCRALMPVTVELRHIDCCDARMTYARQRLGIDGETMACEELERLGYAIIERRYRTRFGEIDVIANDGGTVVFVEVKTKTDSSFSDPVESVTKQKQRRLVSMAEQYAVSTPLDRTPCRFDVVAVDVSVAPAKITVYKDAFRPGW